MSFRSSVRVRGLVGVAVGVVVGSAALTGVPRGVALGASQAPPPLPNPETARVELGRRLFFDPAASRTGTRSCADCHDPAHGYSDVDAISRDARGPTPRRSQSLVDCVDSPVMDWLGALARIEDVVAARTEPITPTPKPTRPPYYGGVITPSDPSIQFVSPAVPDSELPLPHDVLADGGRYRTAFLAAFGEATPTAGRVVTAISAYCKSIRSGESAYDRFAAGDATALSASAQRGLALFRGRGACAACHTMEGRRPTFTDYEFHDVGLASAAVVAATRHHGFKTPTLRDVAARGPFMHDGSLATLADVVRYFLSGDEGLPERDARMPTYRATNEDVADLVAFLESLTSSTRPGAPRMTWSTRATHTRLRILNAEGEPLADWPVVLEPAGDAMPGAPAKPPSLHLTTDDGGYVSFVPPPTTHTRIVLEGGLQPVGGCWIPDTCTEAKVTVPVAGIGRLRVTMPASLPAPEMLALTHEGATFFPERQEARTFLRREAAARAGENVVVVYAGVIRTDVKSAAKLELPPGVTLVGNATSKVTLYAGNTVAVRFAN